MIYPWFVGRAVMSNANHPTGSCALIALVAFAAGEEETAVILADGPHHLFNPTPRESRRDLAADRPDTTESPITADAGALQLEMSIFDFSKNGDERAWAVAPFNLKLGLTPSVDVQFVLDPILRVRGGAGDFILRFKANLFGNDRGAAALAIMPFIKFPTASNDRGNDEFEGGVILPYSLDLAPGVGLGLMLEGDVVYDDEDGDHDFDLVHTAVLGFDVTDSVGWFIEYVGAIGSDAALPYRAELGSGFTLAITPDLMLDAGLRLGLEGDADDVGVFAGLTVRF
jgi:hypothetical protein